MARRKNGTAEHHEEPPPKRRIKQVTLKMDAELVDEARAAASELGGMPHQMTLVKLISTAVDEYLEKLRRLHNRGRSFGPAPEKMRTGRTLKIQPRQ